MSWCLSLWITADRFSVARVKEHRLRELAEHHSQNGLVFIARCTCGWSGSACFHNEDGALSQHRVHALGHIDGSEHVRCCFCGDVIPAAVTQRLFAPQIDELRYICAPCQQLSRPEPAVDLEELRDDLIVLERELRTTCC